ncbi:transglutaminase-like cysteine peptidase [Thaumasiovibrio subtropicus]|uniref:transglutaminase-like cysteine peptidase n=1 Tax=Thaumasiovibrio subtropicus TaxID=1891207 RepID=UPI000B363575|nr:transglutaminase-like cysteine peptidase [Thaumasiovibrio subtropicus]
MLFLLIILCSQSSALSTGEQEMIRQVRDFYGERAAKRVNAWRQLVSETQGKSEDAILEATNRFFNQMFFVDDIHLWGTKDYWATPLEFLGSSAGDCEDFSIAKYFTLRELGISDNKLRLVYVKSLTLNQFHMVVAYYPTPSAEPLLLDNIDGEIKYASKRKDLLPIYSFNGSKLWLMKEQGSGQVAGNASRLSLWNDLRARNDGSRLKRPQINYDE